MNITFDDLFAVRLQCLDLTSCEKTIICQLKYFLYHNGIYSDSIDNSINDFYKEIGIEITLDEIKSVKINKTLSIDNSCPSANIQLTKCNLDDNIILHNEYNRVYNGLSNNATTINYELNRLDLLLKNEPNNKTAINNILEILNTRYNNNGSTSYIAIK
jgi:hypothetical protein